MDMMGHLNAYATELNRGAVDLGYWKDKYISIFSKEKSRKIPLVHRIVYLKSLSVNAHVRKFLHKAGNTKTQIVSFGAGYATLFWNLKDEGVEFRKFVEVDLPPVTSAKCTIIENSPALLEKIRTENEEVTIGATDLHSSEYHLMAVDLNDLSELKSKLDRVGIEFSVPTLFIAELVLVYIGKEKVDAIMKYISSNFPNALFINFEVCNLSDEIGQLFSKGLDITGRYTVGADYCENLETQNRKFVNNNWHGCEALDCCELYKNLPEAERKRTEAIESMDDYQSAVQKHYCLSVAWLGNIFENLDICKTISCYLKFYQDKSS